MWLKSLLAVACFASFADAQVIYEPVNVQYGGANAYYYAGSNPQIHEAASFPSAPGSSWGRSGGYAFVSAHRAVVDRRPRIFTDAMGSFDARVYGMTVDDVVNEANARVPRYFQKGELLLAATARDGALIISPFGRQPEMEKGTIIIKPFHPPLFRRGPVLVIPKAMLDRKVSDIAGQKRI